MIEIKGQILPIPFYLCIVLKEVKEAEAILRVVTESGVAWICRGRSRELEWLLEGEQRSEVQLSQLEM